MKKLEKTGKCEGCGRIIRNEIYSMAGEHIFCNPDCWDKWRGCTAVFPEHKIPNNIADTMISKPIREPSVLVYKSYFGKKQLLRRYIGVIDRIDGVFLSLTNSHRIKISITVEKVRIVIYIDKEGDISHEELTLLTYPKGKIEYKKIEYNLPVLNMYNTPYLNPTYLKPTDYLDELCFALNLSERMKNKTLEIYNSVEELKAKSNRLNLLILMASLLFASRIIGEPFTIKELSHVCNQEFSDRDLKRMYKKVKTQMKEMGKVACSITSPIDYVSRFCKALGLSDEVKHKSIEILRHATNKGLTINRNPKTLSTGAIYIAAILLGSRITQSEINLVTEVSEAAIRSNYKLLAEELDVEITM